MKDLCSIALRILILPATEAIGERCFSQLKVIHNHLRNSLKNDILDCLLRIKLNLLWSNNIDEMGSKIDVKMSIFFILDRLIQYIELKITIKIRYLSIIK